VNFAKTFIKELIDRSGYELRRKPTRLQPDSRFGLNVLDSLVDQLVRHTEPGALRLLQIGANDGKDEDATRDILLRHSIPALLCEPLPDAFAQLKETYTGLSHVRLAQCAVGTSDGSLSMFRIDPTIGHAEATKIASFDRRHVAHFQRAWKLPPKSIICETVPCMTIPTLLSQHGLNSVDVAILDMEGMDHLVCPALLQLDPRPKIIQFEYTNSPIADVAALMNELTNAGYLFLRSGLNIVAARMLEPGR
jgi:FkbM family methyltransferase